MKIGMCSGWRFGEETKEKREEREMDKCESAVKEEINVQ